MNIENPLELARTYAIFMKIKEYLETKNKKCFEDLKKIVWYKFEDETN